MPTRIPSLSSGLARRTRRDSKPPRRGPGQGGGSRPAGGPACLWPCACTLREAAPKQAYPIMFGPGFPLIQPRLIFCAGGDGLGQLPRLLGREELDVLDARGGHENPTSRWEALCPTSMRLIWRARPVRPLFLGIVLVLAQALLVVLALRFDLVRDLRVEFLPGLDVGGLGDGARVGATSEF